MFKWLIIDVLMKHTCKREIARRKWNKHYEKELSKYMEVTSGGGIHLTDEGIALAKEGAIAERKRVMGDQPSIAANLVPGELSENVNWMGIETVGDYLSPIGNDQQHTIIITKSKRKTGIVPVAKIKCTNAIYAEWVSCLCETMWHTKHKVLEDINGNTYPVGDMCEYNCEVRYK